MHPKGTSSLLSGRIPIGDNGNEKTIFLMCVCYSALMSASMLFFASAFSVSILDL